MEKIKKELISELEKIDDLKALNDLRVHYLGKKGKVTLLKEEIKNLSNDEKKVFGQKYNEFRHQITELIEKKEVFLAEQALNEQLLKEKIDISLPATKLSVGTKHPLTNIIEEIEDLFVSMGYDVVTGPEIELDEYNFEKLNLPKDHPARDMQDSLYIDENHLLRTQTSPVQVRVMENNQAKGPLRIISPGKVYRKDEDDATHSHQFSQIEGLVIDENINLAHLKGTLEVLAKRIFGENREIRFRPSYFPFTEPSLEVDVSCFKCNGEGCQFCKNSGWLEILGAGMVHPHVLEMSGYDSKKYRGFAFGVGPERLAMLKYGINDIRQLYLNNLNFLKLFNRINKEDLNESK